MAERGRVQEERGKEDLRKGEVRTRESAVGAAVGEERTEENLGRNPENEKTRAEQKVQVRVPDPVASIPSQAPRQASWQKPRTHARNSRYLHLRKSRVRIYRPVRKKR